MTCETCDKWVVSRVTAYSDGSDIRTFDAPAGKGRCEHLGIDTPREFGCINYAEGTNQVRITKKEGEPWRFWKMGPCPDCSSKGNSGDGACHRCAGTGNVRHYEDGFVGEERTRLHPKEREISQGLKPTCLGCSKEVDAGWVACPFCGHKLEGAAPVEVIPLSLNS